jgi:hypothetical protein
MVLAEPNKSVFSFCNTWHEWHSHDCIGMINTWIIRESSGSCPKPYYYNPEAECCRRQRYLAHALVVTAYNWGPFSLPYYPTSFNHNPSHP